MATAGISRIVQQDYSGGMFSELAPELIPPNGAFDLENGLLNEQNVVYRRGGSTYLAGGVPAGGAPRFLWSGRLAQGARHTVLGCAAGVFEVRTAGMSAVAGLVTPLTMATPAVLQGVLYVPGPAGTKRGYDGASVVNDGREGQAVSAYAAAANRLVAGSGSKIVVSNLPKAEGEALAWTEATDWLQLPEGAEVVAMAGWRTSVVVFTTRGIYILGGLSHAHIVDEAGNAQWNMDRYSADASLWGAGGVAAWKGGLVVACKDDVWLMELGVSSERAAPFRAISQPIRNLYRGYVQAGCTPGQGCVFNGHYFLPILQGASVVDLLVCRLEGVGRVAPAWTHLKGYGAAVAAMTSTVSDVEGALVGATAGVGRVLTLGYFEPGKGVEDDADGSAVAFSVTTRSVPTGNLTPNTVMKARLSYRMVAPPQTRLRFAFGETPYGAEWGAFDWGEADWTAATGPFADLGDSIPAASADPEATKPRTWRVGRKVRFARMRISLEGPASQVSIRALELGVRPSGRVF